MPFHREGVQTNRDAVVTDVNRDRLLTRLRDFVSGAGTEALGPALRRLRHFDPDVARDRMAEALDADPHGERGIAICRLAYRPFEGRWFAPITPLCHRPRPALRRSIDGQGPVLLTVRKDRGARPWSHLGVVRHIPDSSWLSTRSSCRTRAFPLSAPDGSANIDPGVLEPFERVLGRMPSAEDMLFYAIAVLSARPYRMHFDAALRLDYPRLPSPPDEVAYDRVVTAGRCVAEAFLTDAPRLGGVNLGGGTGKPVAIVGHHEIRNDALVDAMAAAAEVMGEVLKSHGIVDKARS